MHLHQRDQKLLLFAQTSPSLCTTTEQGKEWGFVDMAYKVVQHSGLVTQMHPVGMERDKKSPPVTVGTNLHRKTYLLF